MSGRVLDPGEVVELIKSGKALSLAGREGLLSELPPGNWVGGTIPYFMGDNGGEFSPDKIFATELGDSSKTTIKLYDAETIKDVYRDAPENGFSLIVLPALSEVHGFFAENAPKFPEFASRPLIGWIAGQALEHFGTIPAKIYVGDDVRPVENGAAVLHVELPADKAAEIKIVNIYEQGTGPVIKFDNVSFDQTMATIDGVERNLAEYLTEAEIDPKLPFVASYFGAMINTAVISADAESGLTKFYAPVFPHVEYRVAKPVEDFVGAFETAMPPDTEDCTFLCNCILNYVYGELDGKKTGEGRGPLTFGEVAYQLLNQTMAYLVMHDVGE